jgi:hypothetical protein
MAATSGLLEQVPAVPLRDMVVFPWAVQPLFVGTESQPEEEGPFSGGNDSLHLTVT